jgi:hypothetical protein
MMHRHNRFMIPFTQHNSRAVKQRFIKHRQISGQSPAASLPRCLEISGHRHAPWQLNETLIPESALRYYYVNPVGLCATLRACNHRNAYRGARISRCCGEETYRIGSGLRVVRGLRST